MRENGGEMEERLRGSGSARVFVALVFLNSPRLRRREGRHDQRARHDGGAAGGCDGARGGGEGSAEGEHFEKVGGPGDGRMEVERVRVACAAPSLSLSLSLSPRSAPRPGGENCPRLQPRAEERGLGGARVLSPVSPKERRKAMGRVERRQAKCTLSNSRGRCCPRPRPPGAPGAPPRPPSRSTGGLLGRVWFSHCS